MFRSIRLGCAVLAAFAFALPWTARGDFQVVKPDLYITSIQPLVHPNEDYLRVIVKNGGPVGAGACRLGFMVEDKHSGTIISIKYVNVPALNAGATFLKFVDMNFDVHCGYHVYAWVDVDGVVAEKFENNNMFTWLGPDCIN